MCILMKTASSKKRLLVAFDPQALDEEQQRGMMTLSIVITNLMPPNLDNQSVKTALQHRLLTLHQGAMPTLAYKMLP